MHHRGVLFFGDVFRGEIPQAKPLGLLRGNNVWRPTSLVLLPEKSHLMDSFFKILGTVQYEKKAQFEGPGLHTFQNS
jgi:hypothetical protein